MKNILQIVVALPLLLATAGAQTVICRTTLGTKQLRNVPTYSTTSTIGARPTQVLVSQKTITSYKGIVSTSVIMSTTTDTVTDTTPTETATVGSIFYDVTVRRETITNTIPTTTTRTVQSTSTTIVPTVAGFAPIGNTLNQGPLRRREAQNPHDVAKRQASKNKVGILAASYPAVVGCTRYVPNVNTLTTTTTLSAQTNTMTYFSRTTKSTSVIEETETIFPAIVTETSTSVSTMQVQTTTTLFATSMTTLEAVATQTMNGPTYYDACKENSNNFIGPNLNNVNSKGETVQYYAINVLNNGPNAGNSGQIVTLDGVNTREECCSRCQSSPICESFTFRKSTSDCFLLSHPDSKCLAQNKPNMILAKKGTDPGDGYVVGNGKCGYAYSANSDSSLFPVTPA